MRNGSLLLLFLAGAMAIGACTEHDVSFDSPGYIESRDTIVGDWRSDMFVAFIEVDGEDRTVNVLSEGGLVELRFDADGTVAGQVLVPEGIPDITPVDTAVTGSWTFENSVVFLELEQDVFLGGIEFTGQGPAESDELWLVGGTRPPRLSLRLSKLRE